ncbi:MAG: dihydrolipoyl dehydrogenase [Thermoplasmata archaeon]|nr:dihydrolipoyl dehydrogenase [Thermoplasmata archaeon]MBE3142296.1 dihydrolipoyl dehydrogenase [Thermoplasmata archaeon]
MKTYDVIVVGSGSGGEIVDAAVSHGMTVAWVDKGPLGGTCLNVGCIPSKILIHPADRIMEIREAKKLGITAEIKNINFHAIMERIRQPINESHEAMQRGIDQAENLEYYKGEGHFIKDYTLEILGKEIQGEKIFLGSGARPLIPPIKGLDSIPFLTNENVFDLTEKPDSMVIIGGGYIAVEFAHFFSAVGTTVTIFQRGNRLIPNAEPEISELLKRQLERRMHIYLNTEVVEVKKQGNMITVTGKDSLNGKEVTVTAEKILVAAGRKSNADLLKVENTGVKTDTRDYILVNEYLETSKKNIWAFGDAIGKAMFKHVANEEATVAWRNAFHDHKTKMEYHTIPYAVFTYPEIAAAGMTEEEAKKNHTILVGRARYSDVAKGGAMMEHDGFTKAIVDKQTGKILGFHIIGPYAPMLIQEVINAMALGGDISLLTHGLHIHPALPELILRTLGNLSEG